MVSGSAKSFVRGLRAAYEDAFKVPADVAKSAARGLEMRESQPPSKRGGTAVGVARARDLKARKALSKATIKRMVSFFARHRDPESSSSKTRGDGASEAKQADLLWGGSAGKRWANGIKRRLEAKGEYSDEDQATPAPPKDRIKGSDRNPKGSARAAGGIELGARTEKALRGKARNHNMRMDEPWQKTTAGALEAVWRRGAGAYSTSHRPGVSRAAWAMARVNAFLHLLRTGKPKDPKYKSDNDLLPRDHPRKTGRGEGGRYVEAASSLYADEDGGRWITIGAKPDKDGKKKGGTPVYIKGGKITKGPSALKGKALNNLSGEAEQPKETPAPDPKPAATEDPAKEEKASPPPTKDINKISDTLENTALASSYGLIMKTWEKGDRKRIYIKRRLSKGMQDVGYIDIDKRGRVSYESQRINSVIRKLSGWAEELIEGRFSDDVTHYAEGRWITIGSRSKKGGDNDGSSGGAHVFIQNGKVRKGPSAVKGKSLASIDGGKPKTGMAPKAKAKIGAQKIDAEKDLMVSRGGKVESGPSWLVGATISKGGEPKEAARRAKAEGEFEIGDGYKVSRLTYTITKTPAGMSTLKGARITSKEGAVVKRLRDASGENKAPQGKPSVKATPKSAAEPVLKGKLVKPLKAKPVAKARLLSRKEKAGRNIRRTKARQWRAEREGRSRGMRGVLEMARSLFADDIDHYVDDDQGRWITIGAVPSTDEKTGKTKNKGGTPVFITKDGRIAKGPASLKGRKIGKLDGGDKPKPNDKSGSTRMPRADEARARPWTLGEGQFVSAVGSDAPWAAEISSLQKDRMSGRARKEYEKSVKDRFAKSFAARDEWRDGVIKAFESGEINLKSEGLSEDAKSAIRFYLSSRQEKAEESQRQESLESNKIDADTELSVGQRVFSHMGGYGKIAKVNKKTVVFEPEKGGRLKIDKRGLFHKAPWEFKKKDSRYSGAIFGYYSDGRWITIGASEETDEKTGKSRKRGGTPVFIQNGKITKGPSALKGKSIGKLDKDIPPEKAKGDRRKALEKAFLALKAGQSSKARQGPEDSKAKEPEVKATPKEAAPAKGDGMTVRPGGKTVKGKYGPAIIKKVGQFDVKVEVNNPDGSRRPKEERDAEALRRGQEKAKRFAAKMRREAPKKAEEPKESKAPNKTESVNSDAPRESKINLSPEDKSEAERLRGEIAKINEKISPLVSSVTKKDDIWRSFDKGQVGFQRAPLAKKRERELSRTIDSSVKATKLIAERERLESKLSFIESGKAAQRREDMALRKAKREPKGKRNIDPIKAASLKAWRGVMSGSKARLDDGSVVDYEPRETPEGITFDLVLTRSDGTKVKTDPGDTYKTRQKAFRSLVESHLSSSQDSGKSSGDDGPAKSTPKKDEETKKPEPAKLPEFPKERTKENIDEWIKQTSTVGKGLPSARRRKLPSDEKKVTPGDVKKVLAKKAKRERRPFDDPEDMRAVNKRLDMIAQGVRRKAARDSARRAGRKTFAAILTAYREAAA